MTPTLTLSRLTRRFGAVEALRDVSLSLEAEGPRVVVSWSGGMSHPRTAKLKIMDGDTTKNLDVTSGYAPSGKITLDLVFSDLKGKPSRVAVKQSSGFAELDEVAIKFASATTFRTNCTNAPQPLTIAVE